MKDATAMRWGMVASLVLALMASAQPAAADEDPSPYVARRMKLESDALASRDLRRQLLFSMIDKFELESPPVPKLRPLPALLDAARGSTDPLVLQLLLDRCQFARTDLAACDPVDLARRWAEADSQNQVAWIVLADVLDAAHDPASAAEAWRRAGEASTFREGYTSILRSIAAALPADAEPTQRYLDLSYAIGMAAAVPLPFLQKINRRCKDPARWDVCLRIADVASRDGDTLITLMVAKAVTQSAHAPDFLLRRREERLHALQWALSEIGRSIDVDAAEAGDREAVAAANRSMETMLSRGELGAATDYLTSHRITQSEAAARYTAWIEALRLAAPAPADAR